MRNFLLSAVIGVVVLTWLPNISNAQRGGHGGGGYSGGRGGGYSGGGYHGGGYYGGGYHGGGYYGGGYHGGGYYGGRGYYYGPGFGFYLGFPFYGYGFPYYGGSYINDPYYYSDIRPSLPTTSYYYSPYSTPAPLPEYEHPNAVNLEIRVPENATIWIEGQKAAPTGTVRHFYYSPLQPGQVYTYHIRASWTDDKGKPVERTKAIDVQAGARLGVDFNQL